MSKVVLAVLIGALSPFMTHAHMQMVDPLPFKSKYSPMVLASGQVDYSNTSPLLPDGSNFPCKGYQINNAIQGYDLAYNPTATYFTGSTYNMTLVGSATHGGGSCQLSLSYDNGETFKVIKSMIGGCPLSNHTFTIPNFAPSSGSALFAWTWFNTQGNPEMYMNCARVEIQSLPTGRHRRAFFTQQGSMNDLPDLFACNIGNGCMSIEGQDVRFPNPGSYVIHGQDSAANNFGLGFFFSTQSSPPSPTSTEWPTWTGGPFTNNTNSNTSTPITSVARASTTSSRTFSPSILSTSTVTTTMSTISLSSSTIPISSTSLLQPSLSPTTSYLTARQSAPFATPTLLPDPCTIGTITCNSPMSFSICVSNGAGSTSYTYMGSVAAAMQCVNGVITRQNDGLCTPNGQIFCEGSTAFYMCVEGGLIDMGPVALGTMCANGVIGRRDSSQ